MRGRKIMGGTGSLRHVWRTGADEATTLTTDKALVIGGTRCRPASYTLYTLPGDAGDWKLIVNKQTGQWGTEYDQKQDLARVALTEERPLAAPVEQLTIRHRTRPGGGVIKLRGKRDRAVGPFTVAK